jgi:YD repeat-containing protein
MPAKTYLLIASLFLLLIACEKEKSLSTGRSTSADGPRLTKTIWRWYDSAFYSFFYYDEQNRLTSIVDSENTNFSKTFTSFVYDGQGKLLKKIYTHDYDSYVGQDSFWYDHDKIAGKRYSNSTYANKNIYSYDSKGRLIGDTTYSYWNDKVYGYVGYTYDSNDNIVSWQEFHDEGGIMKSDGVTVAAYNNSINPYFDLSSSIYTTWYDNSILSKHLRTQVTYYDGTIENFTSEYYSDGRVKKLTDTHTTGGYTDITTGEFFYE